MPPGLAFQTLFWNYETNRHQWAGLIFYKNSLSTSPSILGTQKAFILNRFSIASGIELVNTFNQDSQRKLPSEYIIFPPNGGSTKM
jgi:hypothetical protein